jgi:excisionase family DNA binding protein
MNRARGCDSAPVLDRQFWPICPSDAGLLVPEQASTSPSGRRNADTMSDTGSPTLAALLDELAERIAWRMLELQRQELERLAPSEERSPWMSTERAAAYLDWPKQRLYKLTAAGAIPHHKQEGRLLFHRGELDRWLERHAHPCLPERP